MSIAASENRNLRNTERSVLLSIAKLDAAIPVHSRIGSHAKAVYKSSV